MIKRHLMLPFGVGIAPAHAMAPNSKIFIYRQAEYEGMVGSEAAFALREDDVDDALA